MLDTLLAGETPQTAQQPDQPEPGIPFWATADGWAPDPDRPGYNMAGDQYRGSLDAPLTVIEFSDFQCPYCRRHTLETQPTLDEAYVDSGKVLWKSDPRQAAHAAIARAGNTIFSLEDDSELVVIRLNREKFEPVARYKVATSDTWSQPVISGNRVFVKDVSSLTLWTIN